MERGGNLYGTTVYGGGTACVYGEGCGTVFELAADGTFTVLHFFQGGTDGANPFSGLIADKNGNLYGTTSQGGGGTSCADGCGTVFKLAPDGTETVLYSFQNGSDGLNPQGSIIMDDAGNLYGITSGGGGTSCDCGTVFKLAPDGTETVLHSFGGSDGAYPASGVILDKAGNLYGTTNEGGNGLHCNLGCGAVFKLAPDGEETVLHAFRRKFGAFPFGGLIADKSGCIYGTTVDGGAGIACGHHSGCGTIFKLKK